MQGEDEDTRTYEVVLNHEEQYSIWLKGRPVPAGWATVGKSGPKSECLAYIEEVWTDMRPLSLRRQMAAFEATQRDEGMPVAEGPGSDAVQGLRQHQSSTRTT